jgi:hypothetical protein
VMFITPNELTVMNQLWSRLSGKGLLESCPKQAGIDIDVFLESLMEDMAKLWNEGVRMWD